MELDFEKYPALHTELGRKTLNLVSYDTGWVTGKVNAEGALSGDGIAENVIRDMQKILHFRVNYTNLGCKNPANKNYFEDGIGSSLQNGEADIAIEFLYLTIPRLQLASPLHPIIMDGLFALFVQPESSLVRNIYFDPLPSSVWIALFLTLFLISCATLWIWWTLREPQNKFGRICWKMAPKFLTDSIFMTLAAMTQSGETGGHVLDRVSSYAISLSSEILSLSVFFVFSARLLAVILHPSYPIQSLEDLIQNDYTFYASPSFQKFLSGQPPFPMGVNSEKFQFEDSWNASVNAIVTEKHARLDIRLDGAGGIQWFLRLTTENSRAQYCKVVSSVPIQKSNLGFSNVFYVSKNSKLKNVLNFSILRVRESGLLRRHLNHPTLPRMRCPPSVKSSYDEDLGMDDVSFAFILLIGLVLGSHVILGLEIMWRKWQTLGLRLFGFLNLNKRNERLVGMQFLYMYEIKRNV